MVTDGVSLGGTATVARAISIVDGLIVIVSVAVLLDSFEATPVGGFDPDRLRSLLEL